MKLPLALTLVLQLACVPEDPVDPGPRQGAPSDGGDTSDGGGDTSSDGGGSSSTDCPDGVICVDSLPFAHSGDTRSSATRSFSSYACAPDTDESGPEIVYRVDLPEDGFLAAALSDWDADVDVHVLGSLDSDDCIDRGHTDAGSLLPAGRYYVVVDTWVDGDGQEQAGQYDLYLGHTTPAEFEHLGLDREVLEKGLYAFDVAWMADEADRFEYTIIDFSLPSTDRRQWTIDLAQEAVLYNLHVAHGEGSGSEHDIRYADTFSNVDGSHQSSLGLMRTAEDYTGDNGHSLRLDGLEDGINDAVRDRAIVVHGAWYATPDFVADYGYLGRSWGCPAVDDGVIDALIADVEDGGLYWSWYPDPTFLAQSRYLP